MPHTLPAIIAQIRDARRPNSHGAILLREIERLRAGIQAMLDGNYPNPRSYRPGKCPHGASYYEDCGQCGDEWLAALLNPGTTLRADGAPTPEQTKPCQEPA